MCYCRFLLQISVHQRHSDETSNFVCDQWVKPEAEGKIASRELTVTEVQRFTYTFRVITQQHMRDDHTFVSIFTCPQHSTFSRVHRLSCGFGIILSSMLTNLMFYEASSAAHEVLVFSELTISIDTLVIAIESSFVCIPINGLITLIFRKIDKKKGAYVVRYGGDLSNSHDKGARRHLKHHSGQDKTDNKKVCETITENIDSENASSTTSRNRPPTRRLPFYWNCAKNRPRKNSPSISSSESSSSSNSSSSSSSSGDGSANTNAFSVLWCWVFSGWALMILSSLVSSFFIMAYGFSNPHYKNVAWTVSFLLSISGDIFVIQPFKVAGLVMIATSLLNHLVKPSFEISQLENLGKYI